MPTVLLVFLLETASPAHATEQPTPGSRQIVAPAGHLQAALLPRLTGHPATAPSANPVRTMHPEAYKAAKRALDSARQSSTIGSTVQTAAPTGSLFNGLDKPGLAASDEGNVATPPDSTGAIGPTRYIEAVNQLVGVYDRTTLALISRLDFATFAHIPSGLGTSDPQIEWDPAANRWLYAMVGIATGNNYLLFGWTKTADPGDLAGGWCTYGVYTGSNLQDYPKLGHDANWLTIGSNVYSDTSPSYPFVTAQIWAFPKPPATDTTCSSPVSATFFADATHQLKNTDGTLSFTPVPANTTDSANDYIVSARDVSQAPASKLMVWHLEARPAPTLVADGDVAVGTYAIPPSVPQPGSSYLIDSLDGRLTQAVARFDPSAGAEALWTQQTIAASAQTAVRWYELIPSTKTVAQQGQLANATDFFWNAAISPSAAGNDAAIFYNRGSAKQLPLIGAQTRTVATPPGQMDPGETVLGTSSAPVTENAFSTNCSPNPCRWGDYSGATPDLLNSHVVWGSNQIAGPAYFGYAQWTTQNFALSTVPPPPDFSLSATPATQTVTQGSGTSYAINIARVGGFSDSVTLSVSGLPSGAGGTLSPSSVSGTSSTLSVTTTSTTPTGSYTLTVSGTSGTLTHSTTATLVINPAPCSSATLSPASTSAPLGSTIHFAATASGCSNPQFEFWVKLLDGSWSIRQAFSASATWDWATAGMSPGAYTVVVWANQSGNPTSTWEASAISNVTLTGGCTSATLSPANTSVTIGSTVHFSATAGGCANPQYEFWIKNLDGSWSIQRPYSTTSTWDWVTSPMTSGTYPVVVWVTQVGDPTSTYEAFAQSQVTLSASPACTSATLSPPSTNVLVTSTVHFSATAGGCTNPQFEFWVKYPDGSWKIQRGYSTTPTWDWVTSGLGVGTFSVVVWVTQVGDSTSTYEAFAQSQVTLTGCTSSSLSPSSLTTAAGSAITYTASAAGCPTPVYQFWLQDTVGSWHVMQAFSTSNQWVWNTAGWPKGNYNIEIWVDQQGADTSTWESFAQATVTLT